MASKIQSVSSSPGGWGPRRGGPYPRLRAPLEVKVTEGVAMAELVLGRGMPFREAAAELGLSLSTGWRRFHFVLDWMLPARYGCPDGPLPPMRGTRRCPRGRPFLPTLDGPGGPLYRGGL